jgi:hypothetical protein
MVDYNKTDKTKEFYRVYAFHTKSDDKIYVCECGYEPYEWAAPGYRYAVRFSELSSAQFEADHCPDYLKNVTIEKVKTHEILFTHTQKEVIEYKARGLPQIIPF